MLSLCLKNMEYFALLPADFYSRKSIFEKQKSPLIQSKIKETFDLVHGPLSRQDRFEQIKIYLVNMSV